MNEVLDTLFTYAFDQGVAVTADTYDEDWVPVAIPSKRMIIINLNWRRPDEIPFQVAHEIAHVLEGDADFAAYHRRAIDPAENSAHIGAIRILVDLFVDDSIDAQNINPYDFMERFRVPSHLEETVRALLISRTM